MSLLLIAMYKYMYIYFFCCACNHRVQELEDLWLHAPTTGSGTNHELSLLA